MFEVGLSTNGGKVINEALFESYSKNGIKYMEVDCGAECSYNQMRKWADSYGVKLWSCHLPFKPFDEIDMTIKELHESTLEVFSEYVKNATEVGIPNIVIHTSGVHLTEENYRDRMEWGKIGLDKLAEIAHKGGARVLVENLPPICLGKDSDEILELVSANDKLGVVFDTNHLYEQDILDYIDKVGDKFVSTHVSDYDFIKERHWLPGEGKIDWQSVVEALKKKNYNGPWLYEVAFVPLPTITRDRDLTCEDFARNAKEIFENKPITVIGKPAV